MINMVTIVTGNYGNCKKNKKEKVGFTCDLLSHCTAYFVNKFLAYTGVRYLEIRRKQKIKYGVFRIIYYDVTNLATMTSLTLTI